MLTLIATFLFLILFGRNIAPYATYAVLFLACLYTWSGSGLPVWLVTVAALACWCVVEALIVRVGDRQFKMLWQVGGFKLAVAMV